MTKSLTSVLFAVAALSTLLVACNNPSSGGNNNTCSGYTLTVNANPASGGTMSVSGTHCYGPGTVVNITARPNAGYLFTGWSGALTSVDTTISVLMDSSQTLTANFFQEPQVQDTAIDGGILAYGGQNYRTVVIGGKRWMAENLNYGGPNNDIGVCYDGDSSNCTTYGRLYDWATVMNLPSSCNSSWCPSQVQTPNHQGICPNYWHVPTDAEWTALTDAVGGSSTAGTKLKSTSEWYYNGNGTDDYGFSALPGGDGYSGGSFDDVGIIGYWWSATEDDASYAWAWSIFYGNSDVYRGNNYKTGLFSVRCVKD